MRPVILLFSLLAAHSLAAPVAVASPMSNSEGLTTGNMLERSVEAETGQNTLERRDDANGGIRTHSA
jgi:hypothetical protein